MLKNHTRRTPRANALRAALQELERIERERSADPKQKRFWDFITRANALADRENHLEPHRAEPTRAQLETFFSVVAFCDEHRLPLPRWARALAKDPHKLLTDLGRKGVKGRHASPLVARKDRLRASYIAAAKLLAELEAKTGEDKTTAACAMLKRVGLACGEETVRRARSADARAYFVADLKRALLRKEAQHLAHLQP